MFVWSVMNILIALTTLVTALTQFEDFECEPMIKYELDNKGRAIFNNLADDYLEDRLVRISKDSNYLIPKNLLLSSPNYITRFTEQVNLLHLQGLCGIYGFLPVTPTSIDEFSDIYMGLVQERKLTNKFKDLFVALGSKLGQDDSGKFHWVLTSNEAQLLQFQLFKFDDEDTYVNPNWTKQDSKCIAIHCQRLIRHCHYRIVDCEYTLLLPLCQYQESSRCKTKKYVTLAPSEDLFEVGKSRKRVFYGSSKQLSMGKALRTCQDKGFQLLDFILRDKEESKEIWSLLQNYTRKLDPLDKIIPRRSVWSWTSATFEVVDSEFGHQNQNETQYVQSNYGKSFVWKSNNERWNYTDAIGHFQWDDGIFLNFKERLKYPPPVKYFRQECTVLTFGQKMRPVDCELPAYFLCYRYR